MMKTRIHSIRVFLICVLIAACSSTAFPQVSQQDFDALKALYNATGGDQWLDNFGWNTINTTATATDVDDSWFGLTVSKGRVTEIRLRNNNLVGTIATELGNLDGLVTLNLSSNQLSGTIPASLGNLVNLVELFLQSNQLQGTIPSQLSGLDALRFLWLNDNLLTDMANLTSLTVIAGTAGVQVQNNALGFDDIAPNVALFDNALLYSPQNKYPVANDFYEQTIGSTITLSFSVAGSNNSYQWFNDGVAVSTKSPSPVFTKSDAQASDEGLYLCHVTNPLVPGMVLVNRDIKVNFPPVFVTIADTNAVTNNMYRYNMVVSDDDAVTFSAPTLPDWLTLTDNNNRTATLQGMPPKQGLYAVVIEATDPTTTTFQVFNIDASQQVSEQDFRALKAFYKATNGGNWFNNSGWDTTVNNVGKAWYGIDVYEGRVLDIVLPTNNLEGVIPPEIGLIDRLRYFEVQNNLLSGDLPVEFEKLTNMKILRLFLNQLTGSIPAGIGNMKRLTTFEIQDNQFSGEVPASLATLPDLEAIRISNNLLTGVLPAGLANLKRLTALLIYNNAFTWIPDMSNTAFGNGALKIADNRLTFESLEPNFVHLTFLAGMVQYNPQADFPVANDRFLVSTGETLAIPLETGGQFNRYQWFKNGAAISGISTNPVFTKTNAQVNDSGAYYCKVTNTLVTGITLTSYPITVSFNHAPQFASTAVTTGHEDIIYTYNITVSDLDTDLSQLTIACTQKPAWLNFSFLGNGMAQLKGTPLNIHVGKHNIKLTVTDGVISTPMEQTFVIDVGNTNDPPTDIRLTMDAIDENSRLGKEIGEFSTTDEDLNETHKYTLVDGIGDNGNGMFIVVGSSIYTNSTLDYEKQNSYSVRVRSTDLGKAFIEKIFTIRVNNLNEKPVDIWLSESVITENTPIGTQIGILTTMDSDLGETHVYSFHNQVGVNGVDNNLFKIVENKLLTNAAIDYETKQRYNIYLTVTDSHDSVFSKVFLIEVIDMNEAPKTISLTQQIIDENKPAGSVVGRINSLDSDLNDPHTYVITTGDVRFLLQGNQLFCNATLDYEKETSFPITIRATDTGGLFIEQAFTIQVGNVNESPNLTINQSNYEIIEESQITITGISVDDIDVASNQVDITLQAANGLISLLSFDGLTFKIGDGTHDPTVRFTANLIDANKTLSSFNYNSVGGFYGITKITITVSDQGFTGSGGTKTDKKEIELNIKPVLPYIIDQPTKLLYENCAGDAVTFNLTASGSQPLQYQWFKNGDTIIGSIENWLTLKNLKKSDEGVYSCIISNTVGIATTKLFSVKVGDLKLHITTKNLLCNNDLTGELSIEATDGWGSYSYSIDGGQNFDANTLFTKLKALTYSIKVKDANNCEISGEATINQPEILKITNATLVDILCYDANDGEIEIKTTGGTGDYTYQLTSVDNSQQSNTTGTFTRLIPGKHTIKVSDEHGCSDSQFYTLQHPQPISLIMTTEPILCNAAANGKVFVEVAGGTPNYRCNYKYLGELGVIENLQAGKFSLTGSDKPTPAATYTATITDQNGCKLSKSIKLSEPSALELALTEIKHEYCANKKDGAIEVTASGGTQPYQYQLNSEGFQSATTFDGLNTGTYLLSVKDANNCMTQTVAIVKAMMTSEGEITYIKSTLNKIIFYIYVTNADRVMWDFGDGTKTDWINPAQLGVSTHEYKKTGQYRAQLLMENECGITPITTIVDITHITDIDTQNDNCEWLVYPNPTRGTVTISLEKEYNTDYYLTIRNVLGQLVYESKIDEAVQQFDLQSLNKGIYWIEIYWENNRLTKKLVVE